MLGNKILVNTDAKGRRQSCIISGTPKPGTHMEIVPATGPNGSGLHTWRAATRADGTAGQIVILIEDDEQGKTVDDAYVSGTVGKLYWPLPGDEVNARVRDQPGTGTANLHEVGDLLSLDGASGMLQAAGSSTAKPYQLLEDLTQDPSGDYLVHVQFRGSQA